MPVDVAAVSGQLRSVTDLEQPQAGILRGLRGGFTTTRGLQLHLHVGLPGGDPDLADQYVDQRDTIFAGHDHFVWASCR